MSRIIDVAPFSAGDRGLVAGIASSSGVSAMAILVFGVHIVYVGLRPFLQRLNGRKSINEHVFFHTQLGMYSVCLLVSNLLSAVAGLIEFAWVSEGRIDSRSKLCTGQAILLQVGDFGGAYFMTCIAIHTFNTLVLRKRSPVWVTILFVAVGWVSAVILGSASSTLGTKKDPFYDDVGLWCWISSKYPQAQFGLHYVFVFLAALIAVIFYSLIFLCLRGTLVIGNGIRLDLSGERLKQMATNIGGNEEYRSFLGAIVKSMLWYPFAYTISLAPIAIGRLLAISGMTVSLEYFGITSILSHLLGLANVIILCNTLRVLKPVFPTSQVSRTMVGEESFYSPERKLSPLKTRPPVSFRSTIHPPNAGAEVPSSIHELGNNVQPFPRIQAPALVHQASTYSINSSQTLWNEGDFETKSSLHSHSGSTDTYQSSVTAASLQRPIIPAGVFNADHGPYLHLPVDSQYSHVRSESQSSTESLGLPAPPRRQRSPITRYPSVKPSSDGPPENIDRIPTETGGFQVQPPPSAYHSRPFSQLRPSLSADNLNTGHIRSVRHSRQSSDPSIAYRQDHPNSVYSLYPPSNRQVSRAISPAPSLAYSAYDYDAPTSPFLAGLSREMSNAGRQVSRPSSRAASSQSVEPLAWASLVTQAALGSERNHSQTFSGMPSPLFPPQGDGGFRRRPSLSSIPMSLRPRTPGSEQGFPRGSTDFFIPRAPSRAQSASGHSSFNIRNPPAIPSRRPGDELY